jgi:TolA-binding protein
LQLDYDDDDEDEDDNQQPTSSETTPSTMSNITQQVDTIQQQHHHQLEDLTRKHNKEKKSLQHQLDQADKQKAQLSDENEKLKQRINYLESERNQLQNTLVDYALKDKHQTDITPDQDEVSETQYPSDIGKNIKMICFGGTANWVAEQRSRFPNIEFAGFEDTINTATIAYADLIFVNTFMFNHALYRPIKHEADRVGKELHILPGKGINKCSNYILDTYREYMMEHSSEKE